MLPLILLQILSGYAILHPRLLGGVMGKVTAFKVHGIIQPFTVLAFSIHGLSSLRRGLFRRGLFRRGIGGRVLNGVLLIVGSGLVAFSIYLWSLG